MNVERFEWLEFPDDEPETQAPPPYAPPLSPESLSLRAVEALPRRIEVLPVSTGVQADHVALYRLRLSAERLRLSNGFDRLLCLDGLPVEPFAHQREAALKALRDMRGRALLADEVGLGKTIEAGLVMKELLVRGLIRRVLILVPASLAFQWQEELESKFQESFTIVKKPEDWESPRAIASLDLAKHPRHAAHALAHATDLLIVDEAHKLKHAQTQSYRFVNSVNKRYVLLLTATPVQNDLSELYNLVTLLEPGQLGTQKRFQETYMDAGDPRTARNEGALRGLLAEVMVRNRRSTIGMRLPARRAGIYHLNPSELEQSLYAGLTQYIREELMEAPDNISLRLVLGILQRELCSSPQAVAGTLAKLMKDPSRDEWSRKRLAGFKDLADRIRVSRKSQALCELLERFKGDQMVVFTEFRATLAHLRDHLEGLGHEVVCFHGGLSAVEKEAAIEKFRAGARVLLSTESGAEGRNLQFCHTLVNFDLPWNPMRVEQRIGRLHRLGQTRPVNVFNLSLNGTIEAHVVELLAHKIRLFELVVGELDLILGDLETKRSFEDLLQEAWRTARDEAALETAFENLGNRVMEAREGYTRTHEANERLGLILEGRFS